MNHDHWEPGEPAPAPPLPTELKACHRVIQSQADEIARLEQQITALRADFARGGAPEPPENDPRVSARRADLRAVWAQVASRSAAVQRPSWLVRLLPESE